MKNIRIGHSYDIHRLEVGEKLILGGKEIEHHKGLVGHSDADCLLHVAAECMLGALALGDLGTWFSDKDEKFKDIDSKIILEEVYKMVEKANYEISNMDLSIYAEKPMINPHVMDMRLNISKILKTNVENINIKATRGERLGFIGREEGIACEAVVLLNIKEIQ